MRNKKTKKSKTVYAKGIAIFPPHEDAPNFVAGKIIISIDDLNEFVDKNEHLLKESEEYGDQLVLDLCYNDDDELYAKVNTYKKRDEDEEEEEEEEEEERGSRRRGNSRSTTKRSTTKKRRSTKRSARRR